MRTTVLILPLAIAFSLAAAPARAVENIDKVNGAIHAETGHEYAGLQTVNGSIQIDGGVHTGSAETVNGSISADAGAQTGRLETVNGGIHLASNVHVAGDITTVNGGVFADRGDSISGDVETVNGAIGLVATKLAGNLRTTNGDITVGVDTHVHGGIHVERNHMKFFGMGFTMKQRPLRVVIGPQARVDGPLAFDREVTLLVHDTARIGAVSGAVAKRYSGVSPPPK